MGRPLRSGRVLKSLSPAKKEDDAPKTKRGGKTAAAAKKQTAPAKTRETPAKRGKAAAQKQTPAKARGRKTPARASTRRAANREDIEDEDVEELEQMNSSSKDESGDEEMEAPETKNSNEGKDADSGSESEEESDGVQKVAPAPSNKAKSPAKKEAKKETPGKKTKASAKQEESEDESSDDSEGESGEVQKEALESQKKSKSPVKKEEKVTVSEKHEESEEESSNDSSSEEEKIEVQKVTPKPQKKSKTPVKKQENLDSSEDEVGKVAAPQKKAEVSVNYEESGDESSNDSDSEDEGDKAPTVTKPMKKGKSPAKKEDSSSEDEVKKVTPAPLKKAKASVEEEEESSDDDSADGSESKSDNEADNKGFTDENAKWLKPKSKMTLMSSDSEEENDEFDEQPSDDDDENMLEVERQSRLIDAEMAAEKEEAEMEFRRTITQQTSVFHLPTPEELEEDENRVVPPSELRARIEDILEVLADFKVRREPGRSRSEYIERLGMDMAELFGYLQELVDYFLSMFGPNECLEFLEASDKSRPLVVRVNTLKARRKDLAAALMKRGVRLDPLAPWSKVGLKIYESSVPIGATPEYLAGHYMLQSAASMCPVMALGPQPGDRVLDMSAAPGGKTSYLSQLMKNKGVVIANDLKAERQKATVANMHRLGVRNVVSCCYDGRKIGAQMRNSFDRILLDAPCSGLGVISRDPSVKVQRTIPDVQRCAHLQKELLLAAIDALNHKSKKGGGFMVYSTCSVAVAENEEVVNYLLSKRDVKLVETGLDFGKPGFTRFEHKRFHPSLALTRRFYPHVHNMDGFYVAKIQKLSDKRKGEDNEKQVPEEGVTYDAQVTDQSEGKKPVVVEDDNRNIKKKQKGKKRRNESESNDDEAQQKVKKKSSKVSYPAVQPPQKKKKKNAKVCKPRRIKVTGM